MAFPARRPHPSNEEALSGALEACTHASTVFSSIASPKFLSSKSSSHTLESTHCRLYTPDPQPACRASEPLLEPCRWSTNVPHSSVHSFIHHSIRRHKTIACTCSVVSNSATPWTAAYQAPPSMGFSRQEYWSGVWLGGARHCSRVMVGESHLKTR